MQFKLIILFIFLGWTYVFGQNFESAPVSNNEAKRTYVGKKAKFKSTGTKAYAPSEQEELDAIEQDLNVTDAASYEYKFVHYLNGNYDLTRENFLLEAYAMRPDEKEVQLEMFGLSILKGDKASQIKFAKIIQYYYSELEYEFYKTLLSNKQKVAIIASGKDDSFPLYILQLLRDQGKEVLVIDLDFLQNENYKTHICEVLEIKDMTFLGNEKAFIKTLVNNKKYPTYISTTVHQNYCSSIASQLYLSGLYYSNDASRQYENLQDFWDEIKLKNLIGTKFQTQKEKSLYKNYLPPMLTLYKLKKGKGEKDPVLKDAILMLGQKLEIKDQVETIVKQYDAE